MVAAQYPRFSLCSLCALWSMHFVIREIARAELAAALRQPRRYAVEALAHPIQNDVMIHGIPEALAEHQVVSRPLDGDGPQLAMANSNANAVKLGMVLTTPP